MDMISTFNVRVYGNSKKERETEPLEIELNTLHQMNANDRKHLRISSIYQQFHIVPKCLRKSAPSGRGEIIWKIPFHVLFWH